MARRHDGLLGIESLEGRRVLSTSAWVAVMHPAPAIHEAPAAPLPPVPAVAAVKSVSVIETLHHGPAVLVTASVVPMSLSDEPAEAGGLAPMERPRPLNELGPLKDLGVMARADLAPPPRPVTLVVNPFQIQSFDAAAGALRTATSALFPSGPPADTAEHGRPLPLIMVLADGRGTDNPSVRFLLWASEMVPPGVVQGLAQGFGQFDLRARFAELAHDALSSGHLASMLDSAHSNPDGASGEEAMLRGGRHAVNPALFGQSGKTDSILAGTGRSTGETPPSFDLESGEAGGTLNHEDVGRLVAVGDTTAGWAAAFWAAGSRALGGEGDAGAIEFALHELLAPRFAFDSAALGEAIRDLVAEADEMGINLLGFLTDPTQRGEMALVAGVATALAYRHWRSGERREQAESRAMLAARFVRGPASLRLARRSPR